MNFVVPLDLCGPTSDSGDRLLSKPPLESQLEKSDAARFHFTRSALAVL